MTLTGGLAAIGAPALVSLAAIGRMALFGAAIGIMGGWLVGATQLRGNAAIYFKTTADFLQTWDRGKARDHVF